MNIPNKQEIHPCADTLKTWLAARKPEHTVARLSFPGFFSDTDHSKDANWFYFAVFGELAGLFMTIYGGLRSGGIFALIAILLVVTFIICDIAFAKLLHRLEGERCKLRSLKLVAKSDSVTEQLKIEDKLKRGETIDLILKTLIFLIALIKVFGIIILGIFNILSLYIPFAIIFILVAYVHIKHTGYFLAYRSAENSIAADYDVFRKGTHYKSLNTSEPVITPSPLGNLPIKHNPHEIVITNELGKEYMINAVGVLTDEEILGLISGQQDPNKIELFKACRKLQLEILSKQPKISKS